MVYSEEPLQNFVKQVANYTPIKMLQRTQATVEEVLYESDIDGMHYYVVRCRPKGGHPIKLSPRERAIAQLVAQGLDNKSIAKNLGITHWTVATYLRRIFGKISVTSRTAMITRLIEENLLFE
jgi:two-component system, NarL family, nitrate/nitrite response regulator NarL